MKINLKKMRDCTTQGLGLLFWVLVLLFVLPITFAYFKNLSNPASALQTTSIDSSFSADYSVNDSNKAEVSINIDLKNIGEYPTVLTNYTLNLGYVKPSNLTAAHAEQQLQIESYESSGARVRINLGEYLLRVDEAYQFSVNYEIENFFNNVGGGYEAILPIFEISDNTSVEYIQISYDDFFGSINYSNVPLKANKNEDYFEVQFEDLQQVDQVIFSAGDTRFFGFNFERKFVSDSEIFVQKSVVFPPETLHQQIVFTSVSPYPDNAYRDSSGNLIFNFSIPPGEEIIARFRGSIKRSQKAFEDEENIYLLPEQKALFLNTQKQWWEIDDSAILTDLEKIHDLQGLDEQVHWIYNYVMDNLYLNEKFKDLHTAENRKGGEAALRSYKSSSAEDFADAFVALCRNADIPARVVSGYVFPYSAQGNNVGMYHVWPQYWEKNTGWISMDPAYEKYTGFNQRQVGSRRVVLAIVEDEMPSVLLDSDMENIFFNKNIETLQSEMEVALDLDENLNSGITSEGQVTVSNMGNTILYWNGISAGSRDLTINLDDNLKQTIILPGDSRSMSFRVSSDKWYVSGDRSFELMMSADGYDETLQETKEIEVKVSPLWWAEPASWVLTVIFFIIVTLVLYLGYKAIHGTYIFILKKFFRKNV